MLGFVCALLLVAFYSSSDDTSDIFLSCQDWQLSVRTLVLHDYRALQVQFSRFKCIYLAAYLFERDGNVLYMFGGSLLS